MTNEQEISNCWRCKKNMRRKIYNKIVRVGIENNEQLAPIDCVNKDCYLERIVCCRCSKKISDKFIIKRYNLKELKKPNYYYHLTRKDWGKEIVLSPRIDGDNRDFDYEPLIGRICVSSEIEGCFVAVYAGFMSNLNVYRTEETVMACKTYGVSDAHITKEYWLTKPTKFILFQKIDEKILEFEDEDDSRCNRISLGDGSDESMNWQKKYKKLIGNRLRSGKYFIK